HHQDIHSFPTRRSSDLKKKKNGQKTAASNTAKKHGNLQIRTLTITLAWSQWAFSVKIKFSAFKEWWSGEEEKVSGWPSSPMPCRDRKSTRLNSSHVKIS